MIAPELYPHQKEALRKIKDGCIVWGGVGSGKSRVGLAYYAMTEQHEDINVITTAKKRDSLDWEEEAVKFGIGKERDATLHGTLTVDSWNNIEKYVDVKNEFFIFDEQRLVGAGKWSKSFLKIARHNRWIMLSATPGDTWLDYIPVFVANGFYRNRTEFKREHVIYNTYAKFPKVDRYVGVGRLVKHRNDILVKMPYIRETTRHSTNVWCEYDEELMKTVVDQRWNPFTDVPIRDIAELFHVMRRVVNTDPSRLIEFRKLLDKHERMIVFYNFNYELDILHDLQVTLIEEATDIKFAEWNGQKHEEIPEAPKWVYAVQYIAGAEGWNCTSTDAMAFWSLTYSYKLFEQAHGRIDRLDTLYRDLRYYTLRSKASIDYAIWRSIKSKKNFQTSDFDLRDEQFAELSAITKSWQEGDAGVGAPV